MPRVFETSNPWSGDPFAAAKEQLFRACKVKVEKGYSTGGHNAFYGGILGAAPDTGTIVYAEHPCHAFMKNLVDCRVAFSRFVHSDADQKMSRATKAYFQWITGSESPWREVFGLGMSEDRPEFNPKFWYKYGFLFDKMDVVPANLLHNFLVATRTQKEWPVFVKHWYKMVQAGCSPAAALFFEPMFSGGECGNERQNWRHTNKYDFPLDHATCTETYLKNFCAGKTPRLGKPFNECKVHLSATWQVQYTPVNAIWGSNKIVQNAIGNAYVSKSYAFAVRDRYMEQIGTVVKRVNKSWNGTEYPEAPIIDWTVTDDQQAEIIKAEEGRLSLV